MSRGKLRLIKRRIESTTSTMQITRAMQMVASARLSKVQKKINSIQEYASYAERIISKIEPDYDSPLVKPGDGTLIVVVSTDMGLCGSFTGDISSHAIKEANNCSDFKGFLVIGTKGEIEIKNYGDILLSRTKLYDIPTSDNAEYILDDILNIVNSKKAGKVKIVYGELKNALIQRPKTIDLLPIKYESKLDTRYEYEPAPEILFKEASYLYMLSQVYRYMYETKVSELYARQNAMKNATENAKNLIDDLTLDYNKLRQSSITTELIEIVNGAQALQEQ
ncbi:ATP synthase gamma chain [Tepiditoga spiralis]|uniref:ATP synthase gamma chain n=1 Tax=Tepiditoga spiralis TaxID=2108365 RepID=A0A7G1GCA5_9BACT|nr:ATP synthase F1 subunit gamma [Tepiditoga spiralis]BBE32029.1 ATP synthase gamma chain [Tepiditoga spiralis]